MSLLADPGELWERDVRSHDGGGVRLSGHQIWLPASVRFRWRMHDLALPRTAPRHFARPPIGAGPPICAGPGPREASCLLRSSPPARLGCGDCRRCRCQCCRLCDHGSRSSQPAPGSAALSTLLARLRLNAPLASRHARAFSPGHRPTPGRSLASWSPKRAGEGSSSVVWTGCGPRRAAGAGRPAAPAPAPTGSRSPCPAPRWLPSAQTGQRTRSPRSSGG